MKNKYLEQSKSKKISWDLLNSVNLEKDFDEALKIAQERLNKITKLRKDKINFNSLFGALERLEQDLSEVWSMASHLNSVNDNKDFREAFNRVNPKVSEFFSKIPLNGVLWKKIEFFVKSSEYKELEGENKRYVDLCVENFVDYGANLHPASKKSLLNIDKELTELGQNFSNNVLDSTNAYELVIDDEKKLKGLPTSVLNLAKNLAEKKKLDNGKWVFNLHAPYYMPVMQYAEDESFRKELWDARSQLGKGKYDNTDIVWKMLKLRDKKAKILGNKNFADYTTKRRMVKSGKNALDFTTKLHKKIKVKFYEEINELEEFKSKDTGQKVGRLKPWEVSFWSEKMRKQKYAFDEEELREYFPIDKVISGLFEITEKLYDVKIVEKKGLQKGVDTWHDEVKYYEFFDKKDDFLRGGFFTDWHPRETKRSGAWMGYLRTAIYDNSPFYEKEEIKPHLAYICGNMTPNTSDKPALLTHREVETIFHEFGHLLHHMLGNAKIQSLNGTNVAWDFVELPSQIMENFCWHRDSLDLFARHWKSGETIPQSLFEKMQSARNFMTANFYMRQLSFGKIDLDLHSNNYRKQSLDNLIEKLCKDYTAKFSEKSPSIVRTFTHLFASSTGYAGGYYSYLWSEMLDADAFGKFMKDDRIDYSIGKDFRKKLLSRGNTDAPEVLFRDFLGRSANTDALLKRAGLV